MKSIHRILAFCLLTILSFVFGAGIGIAIAREELTSTWEASFLFVILLGFSILIAWRNE